MLVSPMTQNTQTRTWMIRFTAAAAMITLIAAPSAAQLGGASALGGLGAVPLSMPEIPAPVSAGADLPGVSANVDGANAQACIDTDAARNPAESAKAQAEALAAPATSLAAPVTSQVQGAASPVTSQLPDPSSIDTGFSQCIDSSDPAGSATGAAAQAQGKATGIVSQIKGFFGSLRGALPF